MNVTPMLAAVDNLLILVVFLLLSGVSAWLTKRQARRDADPGADEAELPSSSGTQERSPRPLELEEVLRRLLGGEPPPQAPPPPPVPSAWQDESPAAVGSGDESLTPERTGSRSTRESYEGAAERVNPTAAPLRPRAALTPAPAVFNEVNDRPEKTFRHFEKRAAAPTRLPTVVNSGRRRRSREGAPAVALVRDARTVRQAFVASLVFGPPKGLEN